MDQLFTIQHRIINTIKLIFRAKAIKKVISRNLHKNSISLHSKSLAAAK
jgi:hypothetical protein